MRKKQQSIFLKEGKVGVFFVHNPFTNKIRYGSTQKCQISLFILLCELPACKAFTKVTLWINILITQQTHSFIKRTLVSMWTALWIASVFVGILIKKYLFVTRAKGTYQKKRTFWKKNVHWQKKTHLRDRESVPHNFHCKRKKKIVGTGVSLLPNCRLWIHCIVLKS